MKRFALALAFVLAPLSAQAANNPANIPAVNTIAAMQSLGAASVQYPTIQVLGYNSANDGGGGLFRYNASCPGTVDGGVYVTVTGVSGACYSRIVAPNERYSVRWFGAKGDCVVNPQNRCISGTDDTVAIQAARTAAIAAGYKSLWVPCGNYVVSGEIALDDGTQTTRGTFVQGEGKDCVQFMFKPASQSAKLFSLHGVSAGNSNKGFDNITITFYDNTYEGDGWGVYIDGQGFARFSNFTIKGLYNNLVLANDTAATFTEYNSFTGFRLQDAENCSVLFQRTGGDNSFHGNTFVGEINVADNGSGICALSADSGHQILAYGLNMQISLFGRPSAPNNAVRLTFANFSANAGFLEVELPTTISVDTNSTFYLNGPLIDPGASVTRSEVDPLSILFDPDFGTYTPEFRFGANSAGTQTTFGSWVRNGRQMQVSFSMTGLTKSVNTGDANVTLPTATNTPAPGAIGSVAASNVTLSGGSTQVIGRATANTSTFTFLQSGSATALATLTDTAFSNSSEFNGTVTYVMPAQ